MSSSTSLSRGRQPRSDTGQLKLHTFILVNKNYSLSHWSMKIIHFTLVNKNYTLSHWSMNFNCFHTGQWNLHTFTLDNEIYLLLHLINSVFQLLCIFFFYTGQWKLHTFTLGNENYTLLQWSMKITHFYNGQWKLHTFTLLNDNYMHTFTMVNEGPRFDTVSVLLSLQKLWVVDTVLWLCLSQLMKHWNDSHRCPILMQVILVVTV